MLKPNFEEADGLGISQAETIITTSVFAFGTFRK